MRHDSAFIEKPEEIKARHAQLLLEINENEEQARKNRKVIWALCGLVFIDICLSVVPFILQLEVVQQLIS